MNVLGIETSCDETAAAVVEDGKKILSNIISSQASQFKEIGGVVPELAARQHLKSIVPVLKQALITAKMKIKDIDAIAVTSHGSGLMGCLLVGVNFAKALSFARNIPLIGINHIEGHIYANILEFSTLSFPHIGLTIAGGHTFLIYVKQHGSYELLGKTIDDAAGEAFDKVARILGRGYPGGPEIEKLSKGGDPDLINFPRPMLNEDTFDFSFSGLKTAVLNHVKQLSKSELEQSSKDIAASFQEAVVDVLIKKTLRAALEYNVSSITLAGGVAANSRLREMLKSKAQKLDIQVFLPSKILCTDNAAMIASAGYYRLLKGQRHDFSLSPNPKVTI